jgi:hypothetical protein
MELAGVEIDFWDFATFAAIFIVGAGFLCLIVLILGLPGRIAVARNHPEAEAVNLMGWFGFFTILPWAQALIWSFKPTTVIDVRRWPPEVRRETTEMIDKMKGHPDLPTGPDRPAVPGPVAEVLEQNSLGRRS